MKFKTKRRALLERERDTYLALWQQAEQDGREADTHNGELLTDLRRAEATLRFSSPPKYIVLAKTHRRGVEALENMFLNPAARNVHIVTPGSHHRLRGHRLEANTHIVYSEGWDSGAQGLKLHDDWHHMLRRNQQWDRQWFVCETI